MLKTFKFLFVNLFIIILILLSFELYLAKKRFNQEYNDKLNIENASFIDRAKCFKGFLSSIYLFGNTKPLYFTKEDFRLPSLSDDQNKNSSIIILGCSVAYGELLKENETFNYLLNKQTNRNIYNFAISGGSIATSIYLIQNIELVKEYIDIKEPVEYVFYTYIPEQSFRYLYKARPSAPQYKFVNNKSSLKYMKYGFLKNSFLMSEINKFLITKPKFASKKQSEFPVYLKTLVDSSKKQFPNSKFVLLVYLIQEDWVMPKEWKNLEGLDLKVVHLNNIVDAPIRDYVIVGDGHPCADAWKEIVPALIKELNL